MTGLALTTFLCLALIFGSNVEGFASFRCGYLGIFGDGNACALSCIPQGYTSGYCEYDQCICGVQTQPLINDLIGNDGLGIQNPSSRKWVRRPKEENQIEDRDSEQVWTPSSGQQDVEDWNAPTEDQGYESDNEFEDEDENEDDSNRRRGHFFSGGRRHKGRHSIGRSSG